MRARSRLAAFALLTAPLLALGPAAPIRAADEGEKTVLGGLLSKALSTPSSRVAIGAVDGALSSDATIRDVAISDSAGPWLKLDRARIVWRRLALLSGRLEVDSLEVGRIEVLRRPMPSQAAPTAEPDGKLLPDLPVKVEVKGFTLAELALGEPVAGQTARLSARGKVRLGAPAEGLDLDLSVDRLDAAGAFAARLLFVPKGERLELKASLKEPAGGLLSKGLDVPGTPPIDLDLDGRGTLDAWTAKLNLDAGESVGAKGGARITRVGAERRLSLDLAARIEGLLPGPAAAVFAGTTQLDGSVGFADSGALSFERLEIASRTARLEMRGRIGADRVADVTLSARALPTEGGRTRAGEAEIERLVFDGSLKGPLARPRVAGSLNAAGLRGRGGGLDRIEASLAVEPAEKDRFAIRTDARLDGLHLADRALAAALGGSGALRLRASGGPDGILDVETLRLDAETARLSYRGKLGQNLLTGRVEAEAPNLSAFSGIAGRALGGRLSATADLSGDPARRSLGAALDVVAERLSLDQPAADRLLGERPRLTGRVSQVYDGYGFEGLHLDGRQLKARIDGAATARAADARLGAEIADLAALDPRLSGAASLDARLGGSLERPDLSLALSAPQATALGRPLREARLEAAFRDLTGALDGTASLSGSLGGKPLTGDLRMRRPDGGDVVLDRLAAAVGSVRLEGQGRLAPDSRLGEGRLRLSAADLDDLSGLALTRLAGRLDADIALDRAGGRQDAAVRATGSGLQGAGIGLGRLDADLRLRDLRGLPLLDGRLDADRLVAGGESLDTIRLAAIGGAEASDVTLRAKARGFDLDGAARLSAGKPARVLVSRLTAARGGDRLSLAGPASFALSEGSVAIEGLSIAAGAGRLDLSGRVGETLDLAFAARALPLSISRIVAPGLGLTGTLDGRAQVAGPATRPEGHYEIALTRVASAETRQAGLPPIEARASGNLGDGRLTLDGRASAGRGLEATVSGSLPLAGDGALALKGSGRLDVALANTLLAAGGQRLAGRVAFDASVGGTLGAPRVEGAATLAGGSFTDPLQGIRLTGIEGRATGRGDTLVLERLTAQTRNGGALRAEGRVALAPESGFPGSLKLTAERAELVSSPLMTAVASLNLALDGPLARTPRIGGRVDVVSIDVAVPDRLPATVQPLPGIRRVNTPPELRGRLASQAKKAPAGRRGKASAPFDARLDLTVEAPNRVFVRGRGIDAELGGALRLTGSSRDPAAVGAFEMRRGRLSVVGQRLDFSGGRLTFGGELTRPDLDFAAETRAADITARVAVTGPASAPVFALTSEPALPQDEVLSRLLFKKASGSLSPFQALQLAQGVAEFSGGGGADVFEQARKGLGLDSLDVSTGTSGGPAIGASRYLSDRLSVGVKAGAKPADTAATVDFDVTRRVKIQGEAGSDGRTAVGVGAEWEY
ncbi:MULTISPECIES: translocation/assembly module TamB domain-containing protein [Methylobacterium]|uniref:Translocation and assembly module TamB C-terminal domain-containing protein n=5 Tax=Pseudomonadota TaxID=1224 RepID=A0ABQ4SX10_9HYPH|nr:MULTISPECIES: translocation/assembly module TamB domain-containing protein [Methylobacterium]PIU07553.1 MAG: hypothetical protein COT56_04855 [Methylobacterium sp. CG09_land_8_20_14_0_10_71_15]PIU13340.1 MAG: hypothetical protein COT28_11995 [Methylobacterium sp. CG08_land_8_20_14_0_20_71_15]GBU17747.1 DUF490 domain-containing protein [Methylobacterium sp.]GJE06423.1 hypothetical protein AOPFMNJM_1741 [Methylobacterium jeotgali]